MMDLLILRLFQINAIKFGEFVLKSGMKSPIYLDLRVIIGYPDLMNSLSEKMYELMDKEVEQLCGVPYTALPLASCISIKHNIPCVIKRKEAKSYGTKKLIEGVFETGMTCCIIEDVITTGSSVIETAKELEKVGLKIKEAIILVDRGQRGRNNLEKCGYKVKSLMTLEYILSTLLRLEKISNKEHQLCLDFLKATQLDLPVKPKMNEIDLKTRSQSAKNKVAKRLFEIMSVKKSNLCVAADVLTMAELLTLAEKVAPSICILKVHADIIGDFNVSEMSKLKKLSIEQNFLLMEDRKFADIGNTVTMQLENKMFDYLSWCDLVTVHCLPGDGVIVAIKEAACRRQVDIGCILISEMSSIGSLANSEYNDSCAEMALRHESAVAGFVSQSLVTDVCQGFVHCTPGVKLAAGGDHLSQQYRSVASLTEAGFVDVFIVGRGITESSSPATEAALYREATCQHPC